MSYYNLLAKLAFMGRFHILIFSVKIQINKSDRQNVAERYLGGEFLTLWNDWNMTFTKKLKDWMILGFQEYIRVRL